MNQDLRKKILDIVYYGKDGHMPSAFSIVDILEVLYSGVLKVDPEDPDWSERDYFILSKGHGCVALYAVLQRHGFITQEDLDGFCQQGGILGEHPDVNKVPGVEASTGSLGHGLPFAVGITLGHRLRGVDNKSYVLVGDGESHEGTVWEAANVAANLKLGNLAVIVDWNDSGAQLMPIDDIPARWRAFGWDTTVIDGHSEEQIQGALDDIEFNATGVPHVIVAKTVKGKGVPMIEGHGVWHHRIPTDEEYEQIAAVLV